DVNGMLRRIGDEHAVMPIVLIDGINEVALAVVGDLVVTDSLIPFITPEYRESIQSALSLPH
ncbi:MAG TPA: hypothetical protein VMW65_08720, partial [Chloroflexota bacterium]|nr:hypothetical protein [Chloroflexota bacterium]